MDYWINRLGEAKGPYTLEQLRSMWAQGIVTADTTYYDPVQSQWTMIRFLFELPALSQFRQLNSLPPLPSGYQYRLKHGDGTSQVLTSGNNNIFLFSGRWGRRTYCAALIGYTFLLGMVVWMLTNPSINPSYQTGLPNMPGGVFLVGLLWLYLIACAAVKRMHDINWPAWGLFLFFIPISVWFTWIFLGIVKGTDGPNRYGTDP